MGPRVYQIIKKAAPAGHDEIIDMIAQHRPEENWHHIDMQLREAVVKREVSGILATAIAHGPMGLYDCFFYDGIVPDLKTPYMAQPQHIQHRIDDQCQEAAGRLATLLLLHPEEDPPAMTCKDDVAEVLQGTLFAELQAGVMAQG